MKLCRENICESLIEDPVPIRWGAMTGMRFDTAWPCMAHHIALTSRRFAVLQPISTSKGKEASQNCAITEVRCAGSNAHANAIRLALSQGTTETQASCCHSVQISAKNTSAGPASSRRPAAAQLLTIGRWRLQRQAKKLGKRHTIVDRLFKGSLRPKRQTTPFQPVPRSLSSRRPRLALPSLPKPNHRQNPTDRT